MSNLQGAGFFMRGKSWLSKYFWSYLLIGVFPLLLGFIFYYTNITTVEREVGNSNFAALSQAAKEMDYTIGEMKNIAYHFSGYLTDAHASLEGGFSPMGRSILSQRIKSYEEALKFPVTIILFFRGGTQLYTSQGEIPYRDFETAVAKEGDLTMSSFYTAINSLRNNSSVRLSHNFFSEKTTATGVVYFYPMPYLDMIPQATLCFMFRSETIHSIFENYLGEIRGNIYLYNEMLSPLYNINPLDLSENFTKTLAGIKGVGVNEQKIDGKWYVIMRSIAENTGMSLVSITKEGDFFSRIRGMKLILFFSILLLELIVLVLAVIMTRRNYKPLRSLLNNFGGSGWKFGKHEGNEFDFIMGRLNSIEEINQELSHRLDRQQPMVAYSCLSNILSGAYDSVEEMDYYLKCANINLSYPWFFVLIVAPVQIEPSLVSNQISIILSAVDRSDFKQCRLYGLELSLEQQVAVIVNAGDDKYEEKDIRRGISSFLADCVEEGRGMKVKISSGRIYDSPMTINASFLEAKAVMTDYLLGKRSYMLFEEAASMGNEEYRYPVIEQSLYIQSIKQANTETALKAMDAMVAKAGEGEAAPVTQCLCFDIINTMMKAVNQLNGEIPLKDLKVLTGFTDLEQFRLKARELTEGICRRSGEVRKEKDSRLKSQIITYVHGHFCQIQFSLQEVADHFDLSPAYLSRFFKQETGHNFIEYVSMLRIDKVKDLLVNTGKQIKEIVYDVGYMDTASFLRKFKTLEGITPGQYRERMKS
jgi:AraC-like DNA-binding protein